MRKLLRTDADPPVDDGDDGGMILLVSIKSDLRIDRAILDGVVQQVGNDFGDGCLVGSEDDLFQLEF